MNEKDIDLRQKIFKTIADLKQKYQSIQDTVIKDCTWAKEHNTPLNLGRLNSLIKEMNFLNREIDTLCILVASAD